MIYNDLKAIYCWINCVDAVTVTEFLSLPLQTNITDCWLHRVKNRQFNVSRWKPVYPCGFKNTQGYYKPIIRYK